MIIKVHMLAFNEKGVVREVEIDGKYQFSSFLMEVLEVVFHNGQNDFQPQQMTSVSTGDVIEYEVGEGKYWIVNLTEFAPVSSEEFEQLQDKAPLCNHLEEILKLDKS